MLVFRFNFLRDKVDYSNIVMLVKACLWFGCEVGECHVEPKYQAYVASCDFSRAC